MTWAGGLGLPVEDRHARERSWWSMPARTKAPTVESGETRLGETSEFDIIIIGGGIAGLTLALHLPSEMRVALLTKSGLGESNTRYAQGGLAAAVGGDDDPELHLSD